MQKVAFLKLRRPVGRPHGIANLYGAAHRVDELLYSTRDPVSRNWLQWLAVAKKWLHLLV
jgi:hypothetical protein